MIDKRTTDKDNVCMHNIKLRDTQGLFTKKELLLHKEGAVLHRK